MSATDRDPDSIVADARWLAHRFDFRNDRYEFVFMPREAHRETAFLDARQVPARLERVAVPRQAVADAARPEAPLHFIFHSGLCCSTLMARALDWDGSVMSLKEPIILGDVVRYNLAGAGAEETRKALDDAMSLLARPFEPGEALVVKSDSLSIRFAEAMLERRPDSQVLCLYAPLPVFLNSLAQKGLWGRLWGRKLLIGLLDARVSGLGFSNEDYFAQTDLQAAACAWLSFHQYFARLIARFGPDRVRTVDSETFAGAPEDTLLALSDHFRLNLGAEKVRAIVDGPVFKRHAKTGEPYDLSQRASQIGAAKGADTEEIAYVAEWAAKVAEALGFPFELGARLIGSR